MTGVPVYAKITYDCYYQFYGKLGKIFPIFRKKGVMHNVSNADDFYEYIDELRRAFGYCDILYYVKVKEELCYKD